MDFEDLERYTRTGPHRICFDGRFCGRRRRRNHAGCFDQHQHDLLEDLQLDDISRRSGLLTPFVGGGGDSPLLHQQGFHRSIRRTDSVNTSIFELLQQY